MKKTLSYGLKSFLIAWEANGIYSLLELIGKIYDSTIYSFVQIYLLAQFIDTLSVNKALNFTDIYCFVVVYVVASIVKFLLKTFIDVRGPYHQTKMEGAIDLKIVNNQERWAVPSSLVTSTGIVGEKGCLLIWIN